ncbi:hypothetical protein HDE_03972 [Halotydeus destructor]|nr:hypothetical protein HDE_03972 [Halotydeus destructor]
MYKTNYAEPCFYRVVKVDPQMDDELAWGRVHVEEIYRGRKYPYLTEIKPWHPDYSLVPKDEEPDFDSFPVLGKDKDNIKVLPSSFKVPPLMAEYLNRKKLGFYPNILLKGLDKAKHGYDPKSLLDYTLPYLHCEQENEEFDLYFRVAEKGEQPTEDYEKRFICEELLEGVVPNSKADGGVSKNKKSN